MRITILLSIKNARCDKLRACEPLLQELLKMMGLPNWMHWLGWMLNSMLVLIVSITIIITLFFYPFNGVGGVVEHSDPTLWWIVLFMYCVSSTAFCFFVSSFFQKRKCYLLIYSVFCNPVYWFLFCCDH